MGHFHRWFLVAPDQAVSWYGEQPIALEPDRCYLIGVHAVVNGRCLIYDTKARVLTPFDHLPELAFECDGGRDRRLNEAAVPVNHARTLDEGDNEIYK